MPRRGLFGRPVLTVTIVLAVLVSLGLGGVALANLDRQAPPAPQWQAGSSSTPEPAQQPSAAGEPSRPLESGSESLTLSATGDIIMGNAPSRLPPNDGAGFFDSVRSGLQTDLVMGNLEQPLTGDTGASKCGSPPRPQCFAFRSPPAYAKHLKEAGFQLLNTANNHSRDHGEAGYRNTVAALEQAGLQHTGAEDQITIMTIKGIKVAVLGFSPYAGANNLNDLGHAKQIVAEAKGKADLVVIQVHMGAEGAGETHVRPGDELFAGENRGDPIRFSHTVIDAGADIVIGHGPHVLRGMEFYKGKLIAYSLGNFAGGGPTLSRAGALKYSGILRVTLRADGSYVAGTFLSTYLNGIGLPTRDADREQGRQMVSTLSQSDFGATAVRIGSDGSISPPT